MASFSVSYKAQFYQGLFDHYVEGPTTYTSSVNFFGDIVTTASSDYEKLGYETRTYYVVDGTLSFSTDKPIKYIYLDLLLCNRVNDVIGTINYSYMGPFNGDGSFDLHRLFGEGLRASEIPFIRVRSVRCDYMDGTSGEAEFNLCEPVEVLKLETPRDRNAQEEPCIWAIVLLNLILTPLVGTIYSLYKLIKGYKRQARVYIPITLISWVVYFVLFLLVR